MVTVQSRQLGAHSAGKNSNHSSNVKAHNTPYRGTRENVNVVEVDAQENFNADDSDDEDEEVATLTGTDRHKSSKMLNAPAFAASKTRVTQSVYSGNRNHVVPATNFAIDANKHRRTPGAPLMRNSAFMTPHRMFTGSSESESAMNSRSLEEVHDKKNKNEVDDEGPMRQKASLSRGNNKVNSAMGFGIVCSPVTGAGKPPTLPAGSKNKSSASKGGKGKHQFGISTPTDRGSNMSGAHQGTECLGFVGRKAVYTPTDVALAKNSDIFLRRTGTGAYSPYTEQLISGIDGVLTDDDNSTPQSVTSVGSQQDVHAILKKSSSKEDASVLSRNEPWHGNFVESSDQHSTRKTVDMSSINSIGSAASTSSKTEYLPHFNKSMTPQARSCFQPPKSVTNFSSAHLKQNQVPVSHVDLHIDGSISTNAPGEIYSTTNADPTVGKHNNYQSSNMPHNNVDTIGNDQGGDQRVYHFDTQYSNQGSFEQHYIPHQAHAIRPLANTEFQAQHENHGMIDNPQVKFHQPIGGHISPHLFGHMSPLNVPHGPSPQTMSPYNYPVSQVPISYQSASPIPLDHRAWHGSDMHRNQIHNWVAPVNVVWNQHQPMPSHGFIDGRHAIPSPPPFPASLNHVQNQHNHQMNWDNQEYQHFNNRPMSLNYQDMAPTHRNRILYDKKSSSGIETIERDHANWKGVSSTEMEHKVSITAKRFLRDPSSARDRKATKQQKNKVLSDSSTKRMNKSNQNQANQLVGVKARGGKRQNSKIITNQPSEIKNLTPEEQEAEEKKAELAESPALRNLLKDFYRQFRAKEKESLEIAASFAKSCLSQSDFPKSIHWRVILEIADLKKRSNLFDEARELYSEVCRLQPYTNQGWLERSKLEEESGRLSECSSILLKGIEYCPMNESLRIRAIKHEERMTDEHGDGDLSRARHLLAPLKHFSIEKVWKTVLEGALMEARAGNETVARQILKYLMKWVSWYGPLYLEAFRLERDYGQVINALRVVDEGLNEIPRYGPLWFGAFRVCEGMDIEYGDLHLPRTFDYIHRAIKSISRELIWKVQMEAAQAIERAAHKAKEADALISLNEMLAESRKWFAKTIFSCPENLCWKVWLAAGRMELSAGRFEEARRLFLKSYSVVPAKGRPSVLLECVRLEEFVGNTELAKAILCESRNETKSDWKVWLQSVSIEVRSGNRKLAIKLAQRGLLQHSGTGRLWATLVQLREQDGEQEQMKALKKALHAVPKSGEVWCEAARMYLNPFSPFFNLSKSSQYLDFATKFTPQYGDSFIEKLRGLIIASLIERFAPAYVKNAIASLQYYSDEELPGKIAQVIQDGALTFDNDESVGIGIDILEKQLQISKLELRCSNADPNYGKLWFHSRSKPSDTARKVLEQAKRVIWNDLRQYGFIYIATTVRQEILSFCENAKKDISIPSLTVLLSKTWQDINLLEGISKADFVTGFIDVNREVDLQSLSLFERRKILFGSDLLLTWKPALN